MIETLLSDRAEERRLLFEEAAGIGRYKDSRQAATRRLEAAEGDLARLQDLVSEVESKVRSLARQKRRAERHRELQERRLDLEVALARRELWSSARRCGAPRSAGMRSWRRRWASPARSAPRPSRASRSSGSRWRALTPRARRGGGAPGGVRRDLDAREREMLVADERRSHAELRIQQLVRERSELEQRASLKALIEDGARLPRRAGRHGEPSRRSASGRRRGPRRTRRSARRSRRERAAGESAALQGAGAGARDRGRRGRAGRRGAPAARGRGAPRRAPRAGAGAARASSPSLGAQTELFSSQRRGGRGPARRRRGGRGARARGGPHAPRPRAGAPGRPRAPRTTASRASPRRRTPGRRWSAATGASPRPCRRSWRSRDRFPGVRARSPTSSEARRRGPPEAAAVETYLGPLLQALVVDDLATARAVRRWFREEWDGGGSLLLLPLDAPGPRRRRRTARMGGGPARGARGRGGRSAGGPTTPASRGWTRGATWWMHAAWCGSPSAPTERGILARREALARLREERDGGGRERTAAVEERDGAPRGARGGRGAGREAEEPRRVAGGGAEAHSRWRPPPTGTARGDCSRTRRRLPPPSPRFASTAPRAAEQMAALERGSRSSSAAVELGERRRRERRRADRLGELEAPLGGGARRGVGAPRRRRRAPRPSCARPSAGSRRRSREAPPPRIAPPPWNGRRRSCARRSRDSPGLRERAGGEIESLPGARPRGRRGRARGRATRRAWSRRSRSSATAPAPRAAARASAAEERHRLDLEIAELRSRIERARERLEVEWGRPWEALVSAAAEVEEGEVDGWREELRETTRTRRPRPREHAGRGGARRRGAGASASSSSSATTSSGARDDLVSAIRQINRTAREVFEETFGRVRENFQRVFQSLFHGGECDVWLADPDDPLESPVEIQASPKGKRTQRIHLLSGGERTLTALALLFSLYLVKPSPFCVLDEVDAPLDESNVGPLHPAPPGLQGRDAVHRDHPQPAHDGGGGLGLRRHDGGAGSLRDRGGGAARAPGARSRARER